MRRSFPVARKAILLCGDTFLLVFSLYLAVVIKQNFSAIEQLSFSNYYGLVGCVTLVGWLLLVSNGLLSLRKMNPYQIILSIFVTVFQLFIVMMAFSFLFREFSFPRTVLAGTAGLQFVCLVVWNYSLWRMEKSLAVTNKVLIIGSNEADDRIIGRLASYTHLKYDVQYIDINQSADWESRLAKMQRIVLSPDLPWELKTRIVNIAHQLNCQVITIPDLYDILNHESELDKIDDIPVFRAKVLRPTLEQRILKRALDLIISISALLLLSPLLLVVAVAVKVSSKGPVFYTQARVGRNNTLFNVLKLRTMVHEAEKSTGPVLACKNDARITGLGRFLRATRIDEIPQLINVIKGDMSIVGPRPERDVFVQQYCKEIPGYNYRHNVKPGITGLAQVYGKYNTEVQDKLVYDLIYIQKCSVFTDLLIMLKTVRVLLMKDSTAGVVTKAQSASMSTKVVQT